MNKPKKVCKSNNALTLHLTPELNAIGLTEGDFIVTDIAEVDGKKAIVITANTTAKEVKE